MLLPNFGSSTRPKVTPLRTSASKPFVATSTRITNMSQVGNEIFRKKLQSRDCYAKWHKINRFFPIQNPAAVIPKSCR